MTTTVGLAGAGEPGDPSSYPTLPDHLLPTDGRFGSGPSKVRADQVDALAALGRTWLGTSHRQPPVRDLVGRLRRNLADLFTLPDGYEVVLGNGGASAFWDVATLGLIERRAQHVVLGEFGRSFATATARAPFLADPDVVEAAPGTLAEPHAVEGVDAYAWVHNETSTGVMAPVQRVEGADEDALVLVDGTSAAGGLLVDLTQTDAYYFSPQKCFGSDGGLWFAILSPRAVERAERLAAGDRWIPRFLSLTTAIENSRADQTFNTPALATLALMDTQVTWMLEQGGLEWAAARAADSSSRVYGWAVQSSYARPFVTQPDARSHVVATVDLDEIVDARWVAAALRANGIVDVEPYRKLGRNQLRVGCFPSVEPTDVTALTVCVDHLVETLAPPA